jgi:hypothetical protein
VNIDLFYQGGIYISGVRGVRRGHHVQANIYIETRKKRTHLAIVTGSRKSWIQRTSVQFGLA